MFIGKNWKSAEFPVCMALGRHLVASVQRGEAGTSHVVDISAGTPPLLTSLPTHLLASLCALLVSICLGLSCLAHKDTVGVFGGGACFLSSLTVTFPLGCGILGFYLLLELPSVAPQGFI